MTENNNMKLWDEVCTSNPCQLKKVTMRGGFISIDAHSQVKRVTEMFGKMGTLWRAKPIPQESPEGFHLVLVEFGHRQSEDKEWSFIYQYGCAEWKTSRKDTPKIAMTDGLTKCISYLGFNADVFMGEWDKVNLENEQKKSANKVQSETDVQKQIGLMKEFNDLIEVVSEEVEQKAKKFIDENPTLAGLEKAIAKLRASVDA